MNERIVIPASGTPFRVAGRARRLAAAFADWVLGLVVLNLVSVSCVADSELAGSVLTARLYGLSFDLTTNVLAWASVAVATALQAVLIARSGQSAAKRLLRLRIVLADGRQATLYRGVVLRLLPPTLLSLVPSLFGVLQASGILIIWVFVACAVLQLVDILPIFRSERRCLHDLLAGTWVEEVPSRPSVVAPS